MNIVDLPKALLCVIMSWLPLTDVTKLCLAHKHFWQTSQSRYADEVWRRYATSELRFVEPGRNKYYTYAKYAPLSWPVDVGYDFERIDPHTLKRSTGGWSTVDVPRIFRYTHLVEIRIDYCCDNVFLFLGAAPITSKHGNHSCISMYSRYRGAGYDVRGTEIIAENCEKKPWKSGDIIGIVITSTHLGFHCNGEFLGWHFNIFEMQKVFACMAMPSQLSFVATVDGAENIHRYMTQMWGTKLPL